MKITYRDLLGRLQTLSERQLDDTVTVEFDGEFYGVDETGITREDDVLPKDHFCLIVD